MLKTILLFVLLANNNLMADQLESRPDAILKAIEANGGVLSENTKKWMKKWKGMDLEDSSLFQFTEISGTTSINLKIQKIDLKEAKGYKAYGSFVPLNESGNPNSEIAYFNFAAMVGVDYMFRPTMRYELGPKASQKFKDLILTTNFRGANRLRNKDNILLLIGSKKPLLGCVKAKKSDSSVIYDEMMKTSWRHSEGVLNSRNPVAKLIQASKDQPMRGQIVALKDNYNGDAFELAREFSILLTLDSMFGQYDRFTGGNVVIEKDELGKAHFVATDNGGTEIVDSSSSAKTDVKLFSRYDRHVIDTIRTFYNFLLDPTTPFLGYTDPQLLVVDMGMYFLKSPAAYVQALKNNIEILLNEVHKNEKRYGNDAYFQD